MIIAVQLEKKQDEMRRLDNKSPGVTGKLENQKTYSKLDNFGTRGAPNLSLRII